MMVTKIFPINRIFAIGSALILIGCSTAQDKTQKKIGNFDPTDPMAATRLMQQGETLVSENRIVDGLARYEMALKLQPKNPIILNLMGVAELQQANPSKALELFNKALDLAPTYTDARNNRGTAYMRVNQLALAEADYLSALTDTTHSNRAGVYYNLGVLYNKQRTYSAAEENLKKAISQAGPIEAYILFGQVEERLGKPAAAEAAYRSALDRAPERSDAQFSLANLLESQGRGQEAKELFERIIKLSPGSPEAAAARKRLGK